MTNYYELFFKSFKSPLSPALTAGLLSTGLPAHILSQNMAIEAMMLPHTYDTQSGIFSSWPDPVIQIQGAVKSGPPVGKRKRPSLLLDASLPLARPDEAMLGLRRGWGPSIKDTAHLLARVHCTASCNSHGCKLVQMRGSSASQKPPSSERHGACHVSIRAFRRASCFGHAGHGGTW